MLNLNRCHGQITRTEKGDGSLFCQAPEGPLCTKRRPTPFSVRVTWGLLLASCLMAGACTRRGSLDRREVSGTVSVGEELLESGWITLIPTGPGVATGGTIEKGQFHIPRNEGPIPGTYRVEILASIRTGRMITVPGEDRPVPEEINPVPAKYGLGSRLTADVTDEGENRFEFKLQVE